MHWKIKNHEKEIINCTCSRCVCLYIHIYIYIYIYICMYVSLILYFILLFIVPK